MREYFHTVVWIATKDLRLLFRQPTSFLSTLMFCLLLVFIFGLTLNLVAVNTTQLLPAILWIILLLAAVLGMSHTFTHEKDNSCIQALCMAVTERSSIFLGKGLANLMFLLVIKVMIIPILFLFFDLQATINPLVLCLTLFFGGLGLACLGTLFNTLLINPGGLLIPILLFPIAIPLLISVIELTKVALGVSTQVHPWLLLMILFNLIFIVLAIVLYDYVLEV